MLYMLYKHYLYGNIVAIIVKMAYSHKIYKNANIKYIINTLYCNILKHTNYYII